jgi:hypothetical protein
MTLFAHTHARESDPPTSHRAAARASHRVGSVKSQILSAMKGREPMNFHEISRLAGIDEPSVWRRLSDLSKEKPCRIVEVGERDGCRLWVTT